MDRETKQLSAICFLLNRAKSLLSWLARPRDTALNPILRAIRMCSDGPLSSKLNLSGSLVTSNLWIYKAPRTFPSDISPGGVSLPVSCASHLSFRLPQAIRGSQMKLAIALHCITRVIRHHKTRLCGR